MTEHAKIAAAPEDLEAPVTIGAEAYVSADYLRDERDLLWRKCWLQAGRLEDIAHVGDFVTFDILDDSVIVLRRAEGDGPDALRAFWNVCPHRGRKLVDIPAGQRNARGNRKNIVCGFHAWTFDLDGHCTFIQHQEDWQGALSDARTRLGPVKCESWGGWMWINLDPDAGPLADYLAPVPAMLDPYQLHAMRPRWRKWIIFDCNWKVALEAFLEPYHVQGTHPQLIKYGDFYSFSRALGLHGQTGFDSKAHRADGTAADTSVHRAAGDGDPRHTIAAMQREYWETIGASTTETLVECAQRLPLDLPEGTPAAEVHRFWLDSARRRDAERGVIWPEISDAQMAAAGLALSIFPNMNLIPGPTFSLYYRVRPWGTDPDKCLFEAVALDRFAEGEEPETEWTFLEQDLSAWPHVIAQDISNMVEVQRGYKSQGFAGCLPNPWQERKVTNLHRGLARYMGTGAPVPL